MGFNREVADTFAPEIYFRTARFSSGNDNHAFFRARRVQSIDERTPSLKDGPLVDVALSVISLASIDGGSSIKSTRRICMDDPVCAALCAAMPLRTCSRTSADAISRSRSPCREVSGQIALSALTFAQASRPMKSRKWSRPDQFEEILRAA
jgi:hypothetical protein